MTTHFQTAGRRFAGLPLICLLGMLAAWQAWTQTTRTVPTEFPTIQEAIRASHDGDTVRVLPGFYQVHGAYITNSIRLVSRFEETGDPADIRQTIISGIGDRPVIRVANYEFADWVEPTISGFTLTNGTYGVSADASVFGGWVGSNTRCTIQNNTIVGNRQGGIQIRSVGDIPYGSEVGSACRADVSCVISNNLVTANGGPAVTVTATGDLLIYIRLVFLRYEFFAYASCSLIRNVFASNAGLLSAAAYAEGFVSINVANCSVFDNGACPLVVDREIYHSTLLYDPDIPNGADLHILNTMIWNSDGAPYRLAVSTNATFRCEHSLIGDEQGQPLSGVGNLFTDPLFADPALGAFALRTNSPCIDAGATNSALGIVNSNGLAPDMGAIEYALPMRPILSDWQHAGDAFKVSLRTKQGRVYTLLYQDALVSGGWSVADAIAGDGGQVTLTDAHAAGQRRYYKVLVE